LDIVVSLLRDFLDAREFEISQLIDSIVVEPL